MLRFKSERREFSALTASATARASCDESCRSLLLLRLADKGRATLLIGDSRKINN